MLNGGLIPASDCSCVLGQDTTKKKVGANGVLKFEIYNFGKSKWKIKVKDCILEIIKHLVQLETLWMIQ